MPRSPPKKKKLCMLSSLFESLASARPRWQPQDGMLGNEKPHGAESAKLSQNGSQLRRAKPAPVKPPDDHRVTQAKTKEMPSWASQIFLSNFSVHYYKNKIELCHSQENSEFINKMNLYSSCCWEKWLSACRKLKLDHSYHAILVSTPSRLETLISARKHCN
jgi:hypothetical protein